jgi:hypothetical protein
MRKQTASAAEIKALVAAELVKTSECADIDTAALIVFGAGSRWAVTLRSDGPRLDEAHFATVAAIGRRVSDEFDLDGPDC